MTALDAAWQALTQGHLVKEEGAQGADDADDTTVYAVEDDYLDLEQALEAHQEEPASTWSSFVKAEPSAKSVKAEPAESTTKAEPTERIAPVAKAVAAKAAVKPAPSEAPRIAAAKAPGVDPGADLRPLKPGLQSAPASQSASSSGAPPKRNFPVRKVEPKGTAAKTSVVPAKAVPAKARPVQQAKSSQAASSYQGEWQETPSRKRKNEDWQAWEPVSKQKGGKASSAQVAKGSVKKAGLMERDMVKRRKKEWSAEGEGQWVEPEYTAEEWQQWEARKKAKAKEKQQRQQQSSTWTEGSDRKVKAPVQAANQWTAANASQGKAVKIKGKDDEGRPFHFKKIVVNLQNVMAKYGKDCLGRKDWQFGFYDWEGARRCASFLIREMKMEVTGVIHENFWATDGGGVTKTKMPDDIQAMMTLQETPCIEGVHMKSSDDEMTIKSAYRRNCVFLDNDNYREWATALRDDKMRTWFNNYKHILHWRYYFDVAGGTFDLIHGNYTITELQALGSSDVLDPSQGKGKAKGKGGAAKGIGKAGAPVRTGNVIRKESLGSFASRQSSAKGKGKSKTKGEGKGKPWRK